jgi:hypothetical protein
MNGKILYRGLIMLALVFACGYPAEASLTWINFANPQISYVDSNLYRFRVDVTWGGETYTDPISGIVVDPVLDRLGITNFLGEPTLWTGNDSGPFGYSSPGDWYGGVEAPGLPGEFGLHGPVFGWDFVAEEPLQDSYTLNYTAFMAWLDYDYVNNRRIEGGYEEHTGELVARVIPEPATILLLVFGFAAVGITRKAWH